MTAVLPGLNLAANSDATIPVTYCIKLMGSNIVCGPSGTGLNVENQCFDFYCVMMFYCSWMRNVISYGKYYLRKGCIF